MKPLPRAGVKDAATPERPGSRGAPPGRDGPGKADGEERGPGHHGRAAVTAPTIARYRRLVLNLRQVLEEEEDRACTRQMLAELLGPVVIGCDDEGKAWAEIEEPAGRLAVAVGGSMGLVAGAGFEPATFGL